MSETGWNISVVTSASSFTSNDLIVPEGGVNLIISGITGGTIYIEEQVNNAYVQTPTNTYTADCSIFVPIAPGRRIRLTGDSLTGDIVARVDPAGASLAYSTLIDLQDASTDIGINLRGSVTVDMNNADLTLSQAQSMYSMIVIVNPGDGSKVLTIMPYDTNPSHYSVYIFGTAPVQVAYDGLAHVCAAFPAVVSNLIVIDGVGMYPADNQSVVLSNQGGTTTAGNTNEQIIEQMILPAACWENDGIVTVNFSSLKSNTATTETLQIRIGDQGDTTDVSIWANTQLATTTVGFSASVMIQKIDATHVRVVSTRNGSAPFGTSTSSSSFVDVAVDNMDNNPVYISVTGTNSTGAETVTSKYFRGVLSR